MESFGVAHSVERERVRAERFVSGNGKHSGAAERIGMFPEDALDQRGISLYVILSLDILDECRVDCVKLDGCDNSD